MRVVGQFSPDIFTTLASGDVPGGHTDEAKIETNFTRSKLDRLSDFD